jgi:serine protease Do
MGIGFAVPADMARQVMDQLVTRGRVTRGYLGVAVQDVTPAVARGLGLGEARGLLVADVVPDGPAARAGVQRGDVIAAVDGKPVEDAGHFRNLVAGTPPGARLRLSLLRGGREQAVEVAVGEAPERPPGATPVRGSPGPGPAATPAPRQPPGLAVADLTPDVARRLGLPPEPGALVTDVLPGGPAAEAGLRPGDVVQEVNRQPVRSAGDFARAVEQAGDGGLVVLVKRGGRTAYVVIERAA